MGTERRPTIAVLRGNTQTEYFKKMLVGFRACAEEADVNLIFLTGPQIPEYCKGILSGNFAWDYSYQFHTIYDYVQFSKPDAIIIDYGSLAGVSDVADVREFVARYKDIPCLLLEDRIDDSKVPYLIAQKYDGMRLCMEHLVADHGYRKVAYVAGHHRDFGSKEGLRAYRDVLTGHGIPLEESMIVHSDYAENAEMAVEELLDRHPQTEAIVFANGNLMKAGYRVCAKRDLMVGHGIAITGFCDFDIAKSMEPPLTSVSHSGVLLGYQALQNALQLCQGKEPEVQEIPTAFHKGTSCGCKPPERRWTAMEGASLDALKENIAGRVQEITKDLLRFVASEEKKREYCQVMQAYFDIVLSMVFGEDGEGASYESLVRYLKRMCSYRYIPMRHLKEALMPLLMILPGMAEDKQKDICLAIINVTQQHIHAEEIATLQTEMIEADSKAWFIPSFTADLINAKIEFEENMRLVMERLKAVQIKGAYFFFFQNPLVHRKNEELRFTEKLYLAAYYNEMEMVVYRGAEWRPVQETGGFAAFLPKERAGNYTAFVLFSGEEQYGILLCEVEQKDIPFMVVCSLQLGSLYKVLRLKRLEQQMKQELEEKNRILNFISAYDALSQLLNRRGFMERAIETIREQKGKHACLLFADIDHLKEINDCFGHAAGDFAIQTAAEYLRQCTPPDAVTARIGGDEFVSLVVSDREDCFEILAKRLRDYALKFNIASQQPFYVEMSVGVCEFICDTDTNIEELLCQSDAVLYEQKKKRRTTIKKNPI